MPLELPRNPYVWLKRVTIDVSAKMKKKIDGRNFKFRYFDMLCACAFKRI
jgi:hypothetical protein